MKQESIKRFDRVRYADTHCHLNFEAFDSIRQDLLVECGSSGIDLIVIPGTKKLDWDEIIELSSTASRPSIYCALGLHPYFLEEHQYSDFNGLCQRLDQEAHKSVVAIGETGLDGRKPNMPLQINYLERHFDIAEEYRLPLILHSVKTHNLLLSKLAGRHYCLRGVIHGFSGSYEQAMQFWRAGFRIGVGGVITYPRSKKTRHAMASLPLEALVLETDSPDMPLQSVPESLNTPLNVIKIVNCLSELRSEPVDILSKSLWKSSLELYNLKL